MCLLPGYCVVPWETTVLIPNGISVLDAAGIREYFNIPYIAYGDLLHDFAAEAYLTAYSALMWSARMRQGESVMIHAVSTL